MPHLNPPTFLPLTGVYEPSAIQQLADGRFLVVEDEKDHPFCLVTLHPDGGVTSMPLSPEPQADGAGTGKLDDLEGLARGPSGHLYAITSHSRDGDGDEKKSRHKLARFMVQGDQIVEPCVALGLKPALAAVHPVLATAAAILDVKAEGGLNIEALEITPDPRRLLLGFRSPLLAGRALIAAIENADAMFDGSEPPRVSPDLITLDLGGHGIRGMSWLPALDGYLVISGPVAREQVQFRVWFWNGQADAQVRRIRVPGLAGFEHAEGITPALLEGRPHIVLVSDDGSRAEGRCARYLLLEPGQLVLEP
ncbi:MAG: DUF3616 domain-containing protein [Thiobacillus sp.]|nr:DUF3616 domain-containing protein [Thiobacillus sp.]